MPLRGRVEGTSQSAATSAPVGPAEGGSVVLTIESAPQAEVGEMTVVARGLTAREQEIVALVLQGASTKDIAATLFLSPRTVQDHLRGSSPRSA